MLPAGQPETHQCPETNRLFAFIWRIGYALVVTVAVLLLVFAIRTAREAALDSGCQSPLNQLHLAFSNYHDRYGCFPPAWIADENGTPMHSWRALILPYICAEETYSQYDFNEPWNGPNNSRLAQRMPQILHCPSEPPSNAFTNFVAIVGPETAFPGVKSTRLADFEDGIDHTILLAEISNSKIPWMEPRDLDAETMSYVINDDSRPSISTSRRNGPYVIFADHIRAHALTRDVPPEVIKALTTIKGHEPIYLAQVSGPRRLIVPRPGPASDANLHAFQQWPAVGALWLNRSPVTDRGLEVLHRSPGLDKLHLAHTAVTDDGLRHVSKLKFLYTLDLSFTAITDEGLAHLAGLDNIYYLDVTGTRVTHSGMADLLRSLPRTQIRFSGGSVGEQSLNLAGATADHADLSQFRAFTGLAFINLSDTQTNDVDLQHLSAWQEIKTLDLSRTKVTDQGLPQLASLELLENLSVAGTGISDAGLVHLKAMRQLHAVDLTNTNVTDAGIADLKEARPDLIVRQ